jgi:hypothetical protein
VCDSKDTNISRCFDVNHVVWKARNSTPSNEQVGGAFAEQGCRAAAFPQFDQSLHQQRQRTRSRGFLDAPRTIDLPSGIRCPLPPQTERFGSPTAQVSFSAASNVFPRNANGFSSHDAPGSPLDFGRPCRFYLGRMLRRSIVQAGQQFCGNIRAFVEGQRESFSQ